MKVLDLFAGLEGWSEPFRQRGHDVISIDIDERFNVDIHADLLTYRYYHLERPDIILASPPCESFSVGSFRHHWQALAECRYCDGELIRVAYEQWEHTTANGCMNPSARNKPTVTPKSETGFIGQALLRKTLEMIRYFQPAYFVIENPRALMRRMPELANIERRTVTYCQYGKHYMKPTDLWGGFPPSLQLNPPCKNGNPCHEAAPRGARTGTQGLTTEQAGKIPYQLALAVCKAAEHDFAAIR